jgi:hypothetical protein
MSVNDSGLPVLSGAGIEACRGSRLDAPSKKVKQKSVSLPMSAPADSEPRKVKMENVL